jgi:hypothetical protein
VEHEARIGRGQVRKRFWWGNLCERDHVEVLEVAEGNIKMDQDVRWGHVLD